MSFLIITIVFVLLILLCRSKMELRQSVLVSYISFGALTTISTYILSVSSLFTVQNIIFFWCLIAIVLLVTLMVVKQKCSITIFQLKYRLVSWEKIGLSLIVFYFSVLLFIAVYAPPNNYDGLTYHLPRAMHWLQNNTVAHYSTSIDRQIWPPPLAEYMLAHFYSLGGGDWSVQLVQFIAYIISAITVTLITKLLGYSTRVQFLSAAIMLSVPMGILQATSIQNDLVSSAYSLGSIYFLLRLLKTSHDRLDLVFFASSFSLAILTKSTSFLYLSGFLLMSFILFMYYRKWKSIFQYLMISLSVVLVLTGPYYYQNWINFKNILSIPGQEKLYSNEDYGIKPFVSLLIQHISIHLSSPVYALNEALYTIVQSAHLSIGYDINEPKTHFSSIPYQLPPINVQNHEDVAPNFLYVMLSLVVGCCLIVFKRRTNFITLLYLSALLFSFLLFCFVIKWQPWISRLHLFFFIAGSPLLAVGLSKLINHKYVPLIINGVLLLGIPWVIMNSMKPLLTSRSILINEKSEIQEYGLSEGVKNSKMIVLETLQRDCASVGLKIGSNDPEYYWWSILQPLENNIKLEHMTPDSNDTFEPCLIIESLNNEMTVVKVD